MSQFALTVVSAPHHPLPLRATGLNRDIQHPDDLAYCVTVHVKRLFSGSRILTACPSLTPLGLSLGPTHPGRINLPQEPLGFRRLRFSRSFSLLIPTFSLPPRPAILTNDLHPTTERSPTTMPVRRPTPFRASVACLSPDHCRRRTARPVSCYALFK